MLETETDRSLLRDTLLDIRRKRNRDFSLLSAFFRATTAAQLVTFYPTSRIVAKRQIDTYRFAHNLSADAPLPDCAGKFAVCRECGEFKSPVLESWFSEAATVNSSPNQHNEMTKPVRLGHVDRSASQSRSYVISGDNNTVIHDPFTSKMFCSRLLGRDKHRTVFTKSLQRVRNGEKVDQDNLIRTMMKVAKRNEGELRCRNTEITTVCLFGRIIKTGRNACHIMLCPDCLRPFKLDRNSFDCYGEPCCGCIALIECSQTEHINHSNNNAHGMATFSNETCAIENCVRRDCTLVLRIFDDLNYSSSNTLGWLRDAAFCERHAYFLPPYSKNNVMRLSMLQHIYRKRLIQITKPPETPIFFVRLAPKNAGNRR